MKKLRIIEDALVEYCIVPQATDELRAIKLTKEQAYRSDFWDEDAEFEDLVAKYGQENILDVGEFYDGFCLLCDDSYNQVVKLHGSIELLGDNNDITKVAFNNRKIYKLCYESDDNQKDKKECTGYANHIFTFGTALFDFFCSEETAEIIRQKLIEGAISGDVIELSDEEDKIVESLIGKFFYSELFQEVK